MVARSLSMRWQMVALLIIGSMWVSGCGADLSSDAAVGTGVDSVVTSAPDSSDTTAPDGDEAGSWTSPLVGGGTFSFANARAKGPFGFWFWAPG